jgi:hypothetical protein
MKRIALILALIAGPAWAGSDDFEEGLGKLSAGAQQMLRGLIEELGPQMDTLRDQISDLSAYHVPEILPNGDILIRRKGRLEEPENVPDNAGIDL